MKNRYVIKVSASRPGTSGVEDFFAIIDKEKFDQIPKDQKAAQLSAELGRVALEKPFVMSLTIPTYNYAEDVSELLATHDYGNTLVEANLPYCLHIPNTHDFVVKLKEDGYSARIILQKIWTDRASGSDEIDFYHAAKSTYFQKTEVITPKMPVDPALGWEQRFTGKNLEKEKDANGVFRYTKAFIEFDTEFEPKDFASGDTKKILEAISDTALETVNKVLDIYRYTTGAEYIERLGSLNITNVYSLKHNVGFYPIGIVGGIGSATMNRPESEIVKMDKMLKNGERPPLFELLRLSAKASLDKKSLTLAVITSFQALEVFLENYILLKYREKGLTDLAIEKILDQKWRTKERLTELMLNLTGQSANKQLFWNTWCVAYDRTRNETIHAGKDPSIKETEDAMRLNSDVIDWIKAIQ